MKNVTITKNHDTPPVARRGCGSSNKIPARVLASEHEQARIGQALHDDICQILTGVSCLIQVSASRIAKTEPDEATRLNDINRRVIEAMEHARAICHGLHPTHITGADLHSALDERAQQSRIRYPLKLQKRLPANSARIPRHTQEQLQLVFRIAQEAICNAVRHGGATKVTLHLSARPSGAVSLKIEDNGRGLPNGKSKHEGMGMRLMRDRAALLGGEITFATNKRNKRGTTLQLTYTPTPTCP